MPLWPSSTVLGSFAVSQIYLFIYTEFFRENPAGIPWIIRAEPGSNARNNTHGRGASSISWGIPRARTETHATHEADGMTSYKTVPFTKRTHVHRIFNCEFRSRIVVGDGVLLSFLFDKDSYFFLTK